MKYDLHVHTKYSVRDGYLEPKELVKIAKKRGLDGIAVTDHNTIKGGQQALEFQDDNFKVIIGSEIRTTHGELIGLFLSEDIKPDKPEIVIEKIKEQNGLMLIPHPFDDLRKSAYRPTTDDIKSTDALEVFNSRCVFNKYNDRALEFATKHKLGQYAGSDAHFGNEIGNAGIKTDNSDVRIALEKQDLEVFGELSLWANHGFTKVLKLWRRVRSGSSLL